MIIYRFKIVGLTNEQKSRCCASVFLFIFLLSDAEPQLICLQISLWFAVICALTLILLRRKPLVPKSNRGSHIGATILHSNTKALDFQDENDLLIAAPVATKFWLHGSFLVVFVLAKNPKRPECF